ncbi:hypothetical protein [Komagataeibacter intermedius]|uniref:Uncharacterized protein n=1 Tax=Komagataeibacter intermedius NRIC 0521 TaxID=1307934 RepID=A0ABQ0PGL9_9PROT|nr:hypothetical protein [Komagataeibacter intermedius]GAN86357.1 hypothetical protein Gain_0027_032 [Komagataeibacter intermedius TF2]GBQ67957.1 hypothetical protein AA0521_1115 [Komagataeibacter intermedius NRIC 0521]
MGKKWNYANRANARKGHNSFHIYREGEGSGWNPPLNMGRFNCRGEYVIPEERNDCEKTMHKYIIVSNDFDDTGRSLALYQSFRDCLGQEQFVKEVAEKDGINVKAVFGPGKANRTAAFQMSLRG